MELIKIIGDKNLSVREMLSVIGLKERKNFLDLYLNPAISEGYVCLLYPNSPRHPRQKYLLTVKGLAVYDECNKSN
ncbi:Fic family protein [Prevotella merdae]|uniref:Fic family protein n=1 Tax=Prevotella merdae TaxID=2079531 RepID=UPI0035618E5A